MERGIKRLQLLRSRRQKAIALFDEGERQAAVAAALKVSRQSVSRWYHDWLNGDTKALHGATRAGRKPRLSQVEVALIQKELLEAGAAGYQIVGMTVAKTALGGKELVAIVRRARSSWSYYEGRQLARPPPPGRSRLEQPP